MHAPVRIFEGQRYRDASRLEMYDSDTEEEDMTAWMAYNELAWTEELLADPEDYAEDAERVLRTLRAHAEAPPRNLLHLGCGAGGHDTYFKRVCAVTGVDLSPGMLEIARRRHPDIDYIEGDMRTLRLGRHFDAVVIPDSIDYMSTRDELRQAVNSAAAHLRPGGVLYVAGKLREDFRENNFAYTGARDDIHLTLLENNHIDPRRPENYEATLVYLLRASGELRIRTENHLLGLFARDVWERAFADAGLSLHISDAHDDYQRYILGEGAYPVHAFVGKR